VLPSLSYFVVVALLREAQGGSASGYAALAILPIVWVALTLRMREVALAVAAGAAVHLTPVILVGGDQYPSSEWRRAMLWVAVGTLVGFAVNSLVRQARSQAAAAAERAEELAASEATIAAVMEVARAVDGPPDARRHACRAARELAAASFAIVGEPAPERELRVTASNGFAGEVPQMSRDGGCAAAFASCRRVVALDADHSAFVSQVLRDATGVRSAVFEPIIRNGRATGVLVVGWTTTLPELPGRTGRALELLAAEVATTIEREDLISRLAESSLTDELTGLPNRRCWEDELPLALERSLRASRPVSVVMLDLDHFKAYNDRHGHQGGDVLLRHAGAAWKATLRATDLLARYGGEEFVAVLEGSDLQDARRVADGLRAATPLGVTSSAGVATWDRRESAGELVRRADLALYAAKDRGRDRTEAAGPLEIGRRDALRATS
jgi:diguanylate cyclase (GGDEF)-like protein